MKRILLVLLLAAGNVNAEPNVQEFLGWCEKAVAKNWDGEATFCVGFVQGVAMTAQHHCGSTLLGYQPWPEVLSSAPMTATPGAMVQTFVNWARENTQHWQKGASTGVMVALAQKFPCNL